MEKITLIEKKDQETRRKQKFIILLINTPAAGYESANDAGNMRSRV